MKHKKLITVISTGIVAASCAMGTAMNAFAEGGNSAAGQAGAGTLLPSILMLGLMFVLLYFMAIRPQKKQEQELKEMQANIQIGDEIVTNGGIVGIVVSIGEDTIVMETGGAKHKLRIKNWAISQNVTAQERAKAAKDSKSSKTEKAASVASAALVDDDDDSDKPKKNKKNNEE